MTRHRRPAPRDRGRQGHQCSERHPGPPQRRPGRGEPHRRGSRSPRALDRRRGQPRQEQHLHHRDPDEHGLRDDAHARSSGEPRASRRRAHRHRLSGDVAGVSCGRRTCCDPTGDVAAPVVQECKPGNTSSPMGGTDRPLVSFRGGLSSPLFSVGTAYTGDVATGQVLGALADSAKPAGDQFGDAAGAGGTCLIFAAAGVYTVSVQFKPASGSVTAKNRKLWVWTIGF